MNNSTNIRPRNNWNSKRYRGNPNRRNSWNTYHNNTNRNAFQNGSNFNHRNYNNLINGFQWQTNQSKNQNQAFLLSENAVERDASFEF